MLHGELDFGLSCQDGARLAELLLGRRDIAHARRPRRSLPNSERSDPLNHDHRWSELPAPSRAHRRGDFLE